MCSSDLDTHKLTLMRLDGLVELEDRLEKETRHRLLTSVANIVRAASVGGDSAGQIDAESFSFVHSNQVDIAGLADRIRGLACSLDPDGEGVSPEMSMVDLNPDGMGPDEVVNACLYIFDRFISHHGGEFKIDCLSKSLSSLIGDTEIGRVHV